MKVLKSIVHGSADLSRRFLPNMRNCGVFVPRVKGLQVGEDVCLWCVMEGYSTELYIKGIVFWRRHKSGALPDFGSGANASSGSGKSALSGAGIGFKSGQCEQIDFLRRVLSGEAEPFVRRRAPRTPLLSPWRCLVERPGSTHSRPAILCDISRGGALAVIGNSIPTADETLYLALPEHSQIRHEMKVAWSCKRDEQGGRWHIGLARQKSGVSADREWASLVTGAREDFASRIWT